MIAEDEQRDFDDFARSFSDRLLRTAYLLTGHRQEAEDLVQVTLLQTARHWGRAKQAPHAYARTVIVNAAKDRWRRRARRPAETGYDVDAVDVESGSSATEIDRVAQRDVVLRALQRLSRRQRAVVVLRFLEDLSVERTAEILGCSVGTVKTQSSRGLRRLRSELAHLSQDRPVAQPTGEPPCPATTAT